MFLISRNINKLFHHFNRAARTRKLSKQSKAGFTFIPGVVQAWAFSRIMLPCHHIYYSCIHVIHACRRTQDMPISLNILHRTVSVCTCCDMWIELSVTLFSLCGRELHPQGFTYKCTDILYTVGINRCPLFRDILETNGWWMVFPSVCTPSIMLHTVKWSSTVRSFVKMCLILNLIF